MAHPPLHANIIQGDGPYYQVKLFTVPRVGERIELTSLANISSGHSDKAILSFEVTKVLHKLQDITEKHPDGAHEVEIYVR